MKYVKLFILFLLPAIVLVTLYSAPASHAADATKFNAGRIIDDTVFTNSNSMSVADIQQFLNSKMTTCDTYGQKTSELGGGTRAQWAAARGYSTTFTCLKDYYENPSTGENNYGGKAIPTGAISAAQIILNYSKQFNINPQVIIVTLQKEKGMVTDEWPILKDMREAMGFGCPDNVAPGAPACDPTYGSFSTQIYQAARHFRGYMNNQYCNSNWCTPYVVGNNEIQWQANKPSCSTSIVNIENLATSALYSYTPYRPNQAALNAGYGLGDDCSAYGNRNFYLYFSDWFGSPNYRPPTCDSKLSGITCIWRLYDSPNQYELLTADGQERDSAVLNSKYSYEGIGFYGFTTQQPGTIPIYRIYLSNSRQHFYTTDKTEMQTILNQNSQNIYEGITLYAYSNSTSTSISYPVYRLNGTRGHLYTTSLSERNNLIGNGYTDEGIAFNTPSAFIAAPAPPQGRVNIYRLINGYEHIYTSSLTETDSLLRGSWKYESVLLTSSLSPTSTPVYRLYGQGHLYTTSSAERDYLVSKGWSYEGIGWYIDNATPQTFRFYTNGTHFYTADLNEALTITNNGATSEGVAFGFNQDVQVPVYRLHNGTNHFYTANINELLSLANTSWTYEGIAWDIDSKTPPTYRLANGAYHFYTPNTSERDTLVRAGWSNEGIAWQATGINTGPAIYRLHTGSYYFYTSSTNEKESLMQAGWIYEGVAW